MSRIAQLAMLVVSLLFIGYPRAMADSCPNPKSAAFSFTFTDSGDETARHKIVQDVAVGVNVPTSVSFDVNTETTFTTTVGRITFRAPAGGAALVSGDLEIVTDTLSGQTGGFEQIVVGFGPVLDDGSTQCGNRVVITDASPNEIRENVALGANTVSVKNHGTDNGTTAFAANLFVANGPLTYRVRFRAKFVPGAKYELFVAGVYRSGPAATPRVAAELVARLDGVSPPDGPVEVDTDTVKIQPPTRRTTCPLTAYEHLLVSIRAEQLLKARIDRYELQLRDALDAVANSGANPGPALRAQDKLVATIRNEVRAELRDSFRAGVEFSKRHLACAKAQLPSSGLSGPQQSAAASEIDQAIVNDDDALVASQTENTDISSEAVRLQGTLLATSQRLQFALFDKGQAGEVFDPAFTLPDFVAETPPEGIAAFQAAIADMAADFGERLAAQKAVIAANDQTAAVAAILAVQQQPCIGEFFDEVEHAYVELHTTVRERLARIQAAAEEAAAAPEPDPNAPSVAEGRTAAQALRTIDRGFVTAVNAVSRAEARVARTYDGSKDPRGFERNVAALIALKHRAISAGDKAWLRMINLAIRRLRGIQ